MKKITQNNSLFESTKVLELADLRKLEEKGKGKEKEKEKERKRKERKEEKEEKEKRMMKE